MRRMPQQHQAWARKKQMEAIQTFVATLAGAALFTAAMWAFGYHKL
eukprot:CAMPEP_0181500574 /NCGR_PEP_ID=MMETSP1110-20121109/55297_1 /TAXON_ID=174948 /ORGANISM="Symbiodinium sp., Strain CCMP421" /LENGTH=45 /DNA_ID= /DNA_START= /DNA_END= /DNA_ORIENTATION=